MCESSRGETPADSAPCAQHPKPQAQSEKCQVHQQGREGQRHDASSTMLLANGRLQGGKQRDTAAERPSTHSTQMEQHEEGRTGEASGRRDVEEEQDEKW